MRIRSAITAAALVGIIASTAASIAAIPITALDPTPQGIITQVNTYLGNLVTKSATKTGELQFLASQSWATNSNVATTMTSLGPQGASTTVSRWFVIVDDRGDAGVVPWYKITP